jgi:hypothetical protein
VANNVQGGHEVYNLATRRAITRRQLTSLPINPAVITALEAIAKSEGQTSLKFTSKGGHIIYDSALTAEVGETGATIDNDFADDPNFDANESVNDEVHDENSSVDQSIDQSNDDNVEFKGDNDNIDEECDDLEQHHDYVAGQHEPSVRRSGRDRHPTVSYEPTMYGKSYDESTIRGVTNAQIDPTLEGYTSAEAIAMAHIYTIVGASNHCTREL